VLQDAWLRYSAADAASIRSPKAFATTIVTRLCLDRVKSARATRESYIGPWLPEPLLTSPAAAPDAVLQRAESVTLAFLVLLETLSPEERAVFLLKDVFEYEHAEVAEMLDITPEHSRQLLHRARARLAEGRPRLNGSAAERRATAQRFARAFAAGDAGELASLVAQDAGMWSDGGGKASAARRPLSGRDQIVNFLVGLHRTGEKAGLLGSVSLRIEEVNCEPALILHLSGRLESVFVLSVDEGRVTAIRVIRNPDKLAHIERQLAAPPPS
jgi:RNA polymerase sigma-70 factor (ECF subfamily)